MAQIMSEVLRRPVRFQQVAGPDFQVRMTQAGMWTGHHARARPVLSEDQIEIAAMAEIPGAFGTAGRLVAAQPVTASPEAARSACGHPRDARFPRRDRVAPGDFQGRALVAFM
jgi:hypothetical protein